MTTEGDYWTITDYPSTSGGRLATLNAGNMEVLFFPLRPLLEDPDGPVLTAVLNVGRSSGLPAELGYGLVEHDVDHYGAAGVIDRVLVPVGEVSTLLREEGTAVVALRRLVLDLMRSGTSAKFQRWHSPELARRAYEVIAAMP